MTWPARILTWLFAFIAGGVYGVAGTVGHGYTPAGLPVGLVLSAIGCAALLLAIRALSEDRWTTLAAGVGMYGVVLVFSGRGPGGSVLVPAGVTGVVWTYLIAAIILLAVVWPDVSRVRRRHTRPSVPPDA